MIINRAPACGGRGAAGRGRARSERGGRTRPRGSAEPRRLLADRGQAGFGHSAPLPPPPNPTLRPNPSAWTACLRAAERLALRHGDKWVRSPRPERRGSVRGGAPPSAQCPQVLRSGREPWQFGLLQRHVVMTFKGGSCVCQKPRQRSNACRGDVPPHFSDEETKTWRVTCPWERTYSFQGC